MPLLDTSHAVQDYLKALHMLESEDDPSARPGGVTTRSLARRLDVSAASATNMLKKLDSLGLVEHVPYRGAVLTSEGRRIALEVVRHHRLLETYLAEVLGLPWDEVHDEAEVLEHVLSEKLEDRIAALLGDPAADPHGHPIPSKDGSLPKTPTRPLWSLVEGESAVVDRVPDAASEVLRYLAESGITPNATVEITGRGPVEGPLFVRVARGSEAVALSRELAEEVRVR